MTADSWDICPRCSAEVAWMEGLDVEQFRTFREDYEFFGADNGEVKAEYEGCCTKCGLSVELHAAQRFYP